MPRRLAAQALSCALACLAATPVLAQDVQALLADTRAQALPLLPKVAGMMQEEVQKNGPAEAIPACKEKAPSIVREKAKETGWQFRRVSLKARNAERSTPDAWEARHLADFDIRAARGEKPETLEAGEVVTEADGKKIFRYLKAIPVGQVCTACHGDAASLDPVLKARLAEQYPHDKATGYSVGQIRGALSVRRPL